MEFAGATIVWNKVKLIKNDAKIVCVQSKAKLKLKLSSAKCKSWTKSEMKFSENCSQLERGESMWVESDVRDIWGDYSVGWLGLLVGWLWGHVCVTIRHYICSYIYRDSTSYSLFHCNHNQNISNLTWLGTVSVCFSIVYRLFCFCCKNCKKMQNGSLRKCWRKLAANSFIINL